jgi:hypothetical protein
MDPAGPDADGDGISDAEEVAGWDIFVDGTGYSRPGDGGGETAHLEARHVDSDPGNPDTDDDGLADGHERRIQSDPRRTDTDGDGLIDFDEVNAYASVPNSVDSDSDSRGPNRDETPRPTLFDGEEVARGSSPLLDDTDADGILDYDEIVMGGSHPAVADLPVLDLNVGEEGPMVWLDAEINETTGTSLSQRQAQLSGRSSSLSTTDESTNEEVLGFTESVEASAGWSGGFEASVTASFEASQTYTNSTTHGTTREAAEHSEQEHETASTEERSTSMTYRNGGVRVLIRLTNRSEAITFRISNVTVIARRFDSASRAMRLVGELRPATELDLILAAGESRDVTFENVEIDAGTIKSVLADPGALSFRVGRYAMTRVTSTGEPGADYAALAEPMIRQTGLVVIDYGNGTVERHAIAANVLRDADGNSVGIALDEALAMAGLDLGDEIELGMDGRGIYVPVSVRGLGNRFDEMQPARSAFWIVTGRDVSSDFGGIRLGHGQRVNLIYWQDDDGDRLSNREEFLRGTDPMNPDTDGDGILDGADESPLVPGTVDPVDPTDPTDPTDPMGGIPTAGLLAHWELGAEWTNGDLVPDTTGQGNDGEIIAVGSLMPIVDRHLRVGAIETQRFESSSDSRGYVEVSPWRAMPVLTIVGWVKGNNHGNSGLIFGREDGPQIALQDGRPAVRMSTHADALSAVGPVALSSEEWTFVVGTFEQVGYAGLRLRLWVNGMLVAEQAAGGEMPTLSGLMYLGYGYDGGIDDVRMYDRALTDEEMAALRAEAE